MTEEEREAFVIYILILSVLKMIENPNKTVSDTRRKIFNGLRRTFLKKVKGKSVRVADDKYVSLNDMVINAWDTTRRELVPITEELDSSLSELIQTLYDRMNRNQYQHLYATERTIIATINSIRDCPTNDKRTPEEITDADNNARKLSFRFLELCGIKKQHSLHTRVSIIKNNIILENG